MSDELSDRERIEEVLVDAYGDYEQTCAWECVLTDEVQVPFQAALFGAPIEVKSFRVKDDLVLQCLAVGKGRERWIGVEDLDPEGLPSDFGDLLRLYRLWLAGGY